MLDIQGLAIRSLAPGQLHRACEPGQFAFADTSTLPPPAEPYGQQRAMAALRLGLQTPGRGYNMFVLGSPGTGRHASVRRLLEAHAATRPAPSDCCYLYNFEEPAKPRLLAVPAGEGTRLRDEMEGFVTELGTAIQAAFEGEEYRSRLEAIHKDYKQQEEAALQALGDSALAQGVVLVHTPQGFSFAAVKDGEPLDPQQFQQLPQAERDRLAATIRGLSDQLVDLMQRLPRLRREMQARIRQASRDTMALAAGHLIDELKASFAAHPAVLQFLDEVLQDVTEAGERLRTKTPDGDDEDFAELSGSLALTRYEVNLLVGHAAGDHAPVVTCDNPTYPNLVGRVDHVAHMGTLVTNFTMVKPGALHRANGGYLLLDVLDVLGHALAWDALKRALKGGQVRIESLPEAMGLASGAMLLEPQPMPLAVKVVLFGERRHYYLLQQLDPEFDELFRIAADFEDDVPRSVDSVDGFAAFIGEMARRQQLRPCTPDGVARLVEHAARIAGHAGRLTTQTQLLEELLHEADTVAAGAGRLRIGRIEVDQALAAREHRCDRLRDRLHEEVVAETLLIATTGAHIGQVNGLAVTELGDFRFGQPLRITATVRFGEEKVVDIERESALGQPLHSKGVMILAAWLGARYARSAPLSLAASLVFEQSYGPVEGDSASLAELCALLSALAGVPLRQSLAVTGSINQFGAVQAIGGVNEKVEGFFDLCRARGLTGRQGVLIPSANVQHLMLRADVVDAAAQGRFHVYPVSDVDEAVALLSGLPAGTADAGGQWPDGSFNQRVAARLEQLASARHAYGTGLRPRARRPRRRLAVVQAAAPGSDRRG